MSFDTKVLVLNGKNRVKHLQDGTLRVIECDKWGEIAPVTHLQGHFIGVRTPLITGRGPSCCCLSIVTLHDLVNRVY